MRNNKKGDKELQLLHKDLIDKGTPSLEGAIYICEGLYLLPNGEMVEL